MAILEPMDVDQLCTYLDDPEAAQPWLRGWGLVDPRRAHANLLKLATSGVTVDLLAVVCDQLSAHLPGCADPDMALNNLERFVLSSRNPLATAALFERDTEALPVVLQIFAASQYLSDLLVTDQESYDLLRLSEGHPISRKALVEDIAAEVEAVDHEDAVLRALRRFKRRETLRIAYGDIIREQSLSTVTSQISHLADAIVEAATRAAWRKQIARRGTPRCEGGRRARFVVLGMGKLGGLELNYSSDIDLIFLYDGEGKTDGRRQITNGEFFERLAREIVGLLTEVTDLGYVYRVDLRLRPDGDRGQMVPSMDSALQYYDLRGRTWERQAYIKARPVAGDLDLGADFLDRLGSWIYRRYLSRADISGIKALKRRIEHRTHHEGWEDREVKTGLGGIRDIEFVIQFLQLLNGGDLPQIRTGNTMEAIVQLETVGCLSNQERSILAKSYRFLRRLEHRLQIMFDRQTHLLPDDAGELRKVALRMGYKDLPRRTALEAFGKDYADTTSLNRRILDHLLHDAFSDDAETEAEVDLVLDPDPPEDQIQQVLGKYPFGDVLVAYRNLMALADEKIRFLSTRRCRLFLAAIAPKLLRAIAATPDPDSTLVNLGQVSDSLGGKGVLWELFSFNPPTLDLYVRLCAYSPYLSGILTSNPGMIDELMDSLILDKLPTAESLGETLTELCRAAEDIDPILHSFKNAQQLRVGVRDILGKEDVQEVTGALSDIAETCLVEIARREYDRLVAKLGEPVAEEGPRAGEPCEPIVVGMGKFGGRELNYHSDLDIVFVYEAEGHTQHRRHPGRGETTTNQHFFSELGQRIIKTASHLGPNGRLYEVDARLRPTGRSGPLAVSLTELARYFASGQGQLWERQALCKARVVYASRRAAEAATGTMAVAAFSHPWDPEHAAEIRQMRQRLEKSAPPDDLKRGPGGIVDVEFLVQMLQLKHGTTSVKLRTPSTLAALAGLHRFGCISDDDFQFFDRAYRYLRRIEGRLRLLSSTARDRLPDDPTELAKLADLIGSSSGDAVLTECRTCTRQIRRRFDQVFDAEARGR